MLKMYSSSDDEEFSKEAKNEINECFRLIGRFCSFSSFAVLIKKYLNFEISQKEGTLVNALTGYAKIIEGYLEALPEGDGFLDKKSSIVDIVKTLGSERWMNNLSRYTLPKFKNMFENILKIVNLKAKQQEVKVTALISFRSMRSYFQILLKLQEFH